MTTSEIQPPSPRARMRELLDALFDPDDGDDGAGIHIPALVDQMTAQIDTEEVIRWPMLRQMVDVYVREMVNQRLARTRGLLLMGDEVLSREQFEKRLQQRASKFAQWREHAGDRHIQLLAMRKQDLLIAAAERNRQGMSHLHIAALWQRLADGMTDRQTVGDRYTVEDIAVLTDKLRISVLVENTDEPIRVMPGPEPAPLPVAAPDRPQVRVRVPKVPRPARTAAPSRK